MSGGGEHHHSHWKLKFHWPHAHHPSQKEVEAAHQAAGTRKQSVYIDFAQNVPKDIPYPPFINILGVPNFRDVGGYACHSPSLKGGEEPYSVRQNYAFRCSELSQITKRGNADMVDKYHMLTLFDLRSEREAANPRGHPKGVNCISAPVYRKEDLTYEMAVNQLRWATSPDDPDDEPGFSQGYVDWYRNIAIYGAKSAYRLVFQHIRDKPEEPFVFHCSAGKDRTGVLSALILSLCGVDPTTIAWEYALTVPGMGSWQAMVEQEIVGDSMMPIRSHGGMTREEAHRVSGSRASNMRYWLKGVLDGEFNGTEHYLKEHCGFTNEDVLKIKKNLIVQKEATVKPVTVAGMEDHPQCQ